MSSLTDPDSHASVTYLLLNSGSTSDFYGSVSFPPFSKFKIAEFATEADMKLRKKEGKKKIIIQFEPLPCSPWKNTKCSDKTIKY